MKKILIIFLSAFLSISLYSQSLGFSYFFPVNGYFSNPIAPLKLSIPVTFGDYFEISPGVALYSIGGMGMTDLNEGYENSRPLVGPFHSFNATIVPTIVIPSGTFRYDLHAGIFAFHTFNTKLLTGNFEQMILKKENFQALSSDLKLDSRGWGWGFLYGLTVKFKITGKIWGKMGCDYYSGSQEMPVSGSYYASSFDKPLQKYYLDHPDARLDYRGFNVNIGVVLKK